MKPTFDKSPKKQVPLDPGDLETLRLADTQETPMKLLTAADYQRMLTAFSGHQPWARFWMEAAIDFAMALSQGILRNFKIHTSVDADPNGSFTLDIPMTWIASDGEMQPTNIEMTVGTDPKDQSVNVWVVADVGKLRGHRTNIESFKLEPSQAAPDVLAKDTVINFTRYAERHNYIFT